MTPGIPQSHSQDLRRISGVADITLIQSIDFEIANINTLIGAENVNLSAEQGKPINHASEELPAVTWHYDSFPFVCIIMLSDCTGMIGGVTALRTPNGEIIKVRGPAMIGFSQHTPYVHGT
ncbi:hypothetical protein BDW67DRAFT_179981 [Aspergillus spinulosporus]